MAEKHRLRKNREGTVINATSKQQEKVLFKALYKVEEYLVHSFADVRLLHEKQLYLKDAVKNLRHIFPNTEFYFHLETSSMKPDGGLLYLLDKDQNKYPILISEVKNQGANDLRMKEGKPKQARGNAIERLGKNVIGFKTSMLAESIFPFICFGYGCDFEDGSSILDRVVTMAMFGKLNKTYLHNSEEAPINRGSFYFRKDEWQVDEMYEVMKDIAEKSIYYYFSKIGRDKFL